MVWRRDLESRAERFERALVEPLHLFDEETQELVRVARSLRPAIQQSETRRAAIKERAMIAFLEGHGLSSDPSPTLPADDFAENTSATSILHPMLGRVVVSDVEDIDAERAQRIADRLEQVLGEHANRPRGDR